MHKSKGAPITQSHTETARVDINTLSLSEKTTILPSQVIVHIHRMKVSNSYRNISNVVLIFRSYRSAVLRLTIIPTNDKTVAR